MSEMPMIFVYMILISVVGVALFLGAASIFIRLAEIRYAKKLLRVEGEDNDLQAKEEVRVEARARLFEQLDSYLEHCSLDQLRDLSIFVERHPNIMDVEQLAQGQREKKDLHEVHVLAPQFLEIGFPRVLQSTLSILKDDTRTVIFFYYIDESTVPKFYWLRDRLAREGNIGDDEIKHCVRKVVIDSNFHLTDFTLWNPDHEHPRGFVNLKHTTPDGLQTDLCIEMTPAHVADIALKLTYLRELYEDAQNVVLSQVGEEVETPLTLVADTNGHRLAS